MLRLHLRRVRDKVAANQPRSPPIIYSSSGGTKRSAKRIGKDLIECLLRLRLIRSIPLRTSRSLMLIFRIKP